MTFADSYDSILFHSLRIAVPAPGCVGLLLIGLVGGCGQDANADSPALGSEPTTARMMAQPQSALRLDPDGAPVDDSDQRRGYGAVDMRFEACVGRDGDYLLSGKACPSGILVYGPYVAVPPNSQIEVSFELKPDRTVQVYADLVSQMGRRVLAGLNPQLVAVGQSQKLGFFVNVLKGEENVESRIGFRTDEPVEFVLSNLTMTVR
jgi:hypothetical protein